MPAKKNTPLIEPPGRWTLIKDIISFQFKLMVDGFRDFILVPVSVFVGILCLLKPGKPSTAFYTLLRAGRGTERWINLFGAADRPILREAADKSGADIDDLLRMAEEYAVAKVQSGELTRQAKEHFDYILKTVRARRD